MSWKKNCRPRKCRITNGEENLKKPKSVQPSHSKTWRAQNKDKFHRNVQINSLSNRANVFTDAGVTTRILVEQQVTSKKSKTFLEGVEEDTRIWRVIAAAARNDPQSPHQWGRLKKNHDREGTTIIVLSVYHWRHRGGMRVREIMPQLVFRGAQRWEEFWDLTSHQRNNWIIPRDLSTRACIMKMSTGS